MNNNCSDQTKSIVSILTNLTPFEFTFLGSIVGYVLAFNLSPNEQNALGNWFELVGQILLTFSAQGTVSLTENQYDELMNEINELKRKINT